jgi:hypothetical protein
LGSSSLAPFNPVEEVLEDNPRFEMISFPSACSDLNPQEKNWKTDSKEDNHNHLELRLPELAHRFEKELNSCPSQFYTLAALLNCYSSNVF